MRVLENAFLVFNSDDLGFHSFTKGSVSLGMSSHWKFVRLLKISMLKGSILVIARASVAHCNYIILGGRLQKTEMVLTSLAQEEVKLLKRWTFP